MSFLSAAFALTGALAGAGGGVTLAGVHLTGLSTPEKINFGGAQMVAVHKLPGGDRIVHVLGADEKDIKFSGIFSGAGAVSTALKIDTARKAGIPVALTWPGFHRQVVIAEFDCSYESGGFLLPYSVRCIVVPSPPPAPKPTLLGSLGKDVQKSLGITGIVSSVQGIVKKADALTSPLLADAQGALLSVQGVLPIAGALTGGSAAFLSVQGAINKASSLTGAAASLADGNMSAVIDAASSVGGVIGGSNGATAISALTTAASAAGDLANTLAANGFVKRMAANIQAAI
ncbi:hypothetical protein [Acidocella aminolytica]|uniref:Uncharacterized protein n=1 Tax=Acidocella aminolytica 101 = DSM 11237 TaxID=1120923 RepID=A0A0D6PEJ5_9PROT|nr:hypothetical protein [Acidocella aminolytica]GAN79771.1 hypothetical protein Aam_030_004 [Acidocella aminolytica 101 = DSM 11237]GBQ32000.1 hypothetical protein AA11237_0039 [Acidocella aminolytica 101 = DSM 11237]SHF35886.1 hypothetical protein SAMN02746095_02961 [Acidocella aminolytica 101 = DSM 11237]